MTRPRSAIHRLSPQLLALLAALLLTACWACAQPVPLPPPPATPIVQRTQGESHPLSLSSGSNLYSIGEPTALEQFYLELINRARANPLSEGLRLQALTDPDVLNAYQYFNVNLNQMVQDMSALPIAPPLAFHPALIQSARLHSQDMFDNEFQGHSSSDGLSPGQRISAQNYNWSTYGENVYAYAESVEHGHAGFEVDWGSGPNGMQSPPGHRINIHTRAFREVGIGVVEGTHGSVGPQLVTQDFATRFGATPLITGVVYYDLNQNGFYDVGEGLPGVRVDVAGVSSYAITAQAGGYAVPVPGDGSYAVTFSATGLDQTLNAQVSNLENVKVDLAPAYAPPQLTGPTAVSVGQTNAYALSTVAAAVGYEVRQSRLAPFTTTFDAENGLTAVTATVSSGYNVIDTSIKANGSASYHLAHPDPSDQVLALTPVLRPTSSSQLTFSSRLGWATTTQVARAELSTDDGLTWQTVWSRAGTGNAGQTSFAAVAVPLASFADLEIHIRFVYEVTGGSYYVGGSSGLGWYLDNVTVSAADAVVATSILAVPTPPSVSFTPTQEGTYLLKARAQAGNAWLPWGPALPVTASTYVLPLLELQGFPMMVGSRVEFQVLRMAGSPGTMVAEISPTPTGPWTVDASATFQTLVEGTSWKASVAQGSTPMTFYRVRSQ